MLSYQMPSINSVRRKMNMLKMVLIGTLTWKFCSSLYKKTFTRRSLQEGHLFSSVQSCLTLCDPMGCRMPGFPVHHQLPQLAQTHVHWVGEAIQPSHPVLSPSPPAFNLSQHQGLFQWVSSSHQVARVLEVQHQSFQWKFRTAFL